ncbi:MAG: hypothetical protein HETSPECPRED_002544 [Heterodermia speciosa]|uniref:Uncharacterized protein n=1 Tax=Heterodermia speciosa TaxID=116794 RepID=A0A8H3IJ77_9LECA|nr:MAG: hypothetical protein HETSPECPRED_002544 [Heterodermia speciosa]
MPLANPISREQLMALRHRLILDLVTNDFPAPAIVWPASQNIIIGNMSLLTDERLNAATALLRSLDLKTILQESREACRSESNTDPGEKADGPILASVVGLERLAIQTLRVAKKLYAGVVDREHVLPEFVKRIQTIFDQRGLLSPETKNDRFPPRVKIIDTTRIKLRKDPDSEKNVRTLALDAREMYIKYKDFVWAENIPLQTVSISKTPLRNFTRGSILVDQGYRDVVSVPLPGASALDPAEYWNGLKLRPARIFHETSHNSFRRVGVGDTYDNTKS